MVTATVAFSSSRGTAAKPVIDVIMSEPVGARALVRPRSSARRADHLPAFEAGPGPAASRLGALGAGPAGVIGVPRPESVGQDAPEGRRYPELSGHFSVDAEVADYVGRVGHAGGLFRFRAPMRSAA